MYTLLPEINNIGSDIGAKAESKLADLCLRCLGYFSKIFYGE